MSVENSIIYDAYVDGSFTAKFDKGAWAYTIVDNETDKSIAEGVGLLNYTLQPELRKLRNIATECRAVIEALDYASVYNMRLNVYYDYIGLQRWVWDITENQTPWQCKNDFTWEYRQDVIRYEEYLNKMIWVKGHNGNKWNEYTDELATRLTGTNQKKAKV